MGMMSSLLVLEHVVLNCRHVFVERSLNLFKGSVDSVSAFQGSLNGVLDGLLLSIHCSDLFLEILLSSILLGSLRGITFSMSLYTGLGRLVRVPGLLLALRELGDTSRDGLGGGESAKGSNSGELHFASC